MSVAVQLLDERRVKVRAKSHVCGSMTVSCNLVRVLILEIFMMAGRVLFGGIIRLRLSHGGVITFATMASRNAAPWLYTPHSSADSPSHRTAPGPGQCPCQRVL